MAFVDELKIHIKAGKGGNGIAHFLHEKFKEFGGPDGGDGGKGGDVYIRGVKDLGLLSRYIHKDTFEAENGERGGGGRKTGRSGDDLVIDFPVGSILINLSTGERFELTKEGEKLLILKGGAGGLGNERFKSSTNQTPKEFTRGEKGEEADFEIELELFADAGFVGLPSAGKSSLLNVLTNAKSKVAEYHFTTLEPHLGDFYGFILADIPGLIEGASEGKGLGHKFLRHIKRTKIIFHLISANSDDPLQDYKIIRNELENYNTSLGEKDEIIIISKIDEVSDKKLKGVEKLFEGKKVLKSTILDDEVIKNLSDEISKILKK